MLVEIKRLIEKDVHLQAATSTPVAPDAGGISQPSFFLSKTVIEVRPNEITLASLADIVAESTQQSVPMSGTDLITYVSDRKANSQAKFGNNVLGSVFNETNKACMESTIIIRSKEVKDSSLNYLRRPRRPRRPRCPHGLRLRVETCSRCDEEKSKKKKAA